MAEEWLTYSALGERLGVSPEAARQKALRLGLRKQTRNDGKVQVLVDVEDVKATMTPRKPKDDEEAEEPTAEEHPFDARVIDALEAHLATMRGMVETAEATAQRERERADTERTRADGERDRADAERGRADELQKRIDELSRERAEKAERESEIRGEVAKLRAMVDDLNRPWWKRLRG